MFVLFHLTTLIFLVINEGISKEYCDPETSYRCSSNNFCISKAKKCNGLWDCKGGEDEADCEFHGNERDLQTALINGYTCRGICQEGSRPCKAPKKSCVPDDECGLSCINKNAACERPPPVVEHSIRYEIWKATPNRLLKIRPGSPFLYGYVASYLCKPGRRLEGLLPRCSGTKQWSNNIPVCVDFDKCGQAEDVGNIVDQARLSLQRIINGEDSNANAWPWQALITKYKNTPKEVLGDKNLVGGGGGSIINKQWILTAAHMLHGRNWENNYVVSVGVFERPTDGAELKSTIEMYSIDKYIRHEDYDDDTIVNDIALIKLGARYDSRMQKINSDTEGLVFSYYIRPVCLPCKGTCLTEEILLHGNVNLEGKGNAERCLAEEKILLENDAKVVATGFGHLDAYITGERGKLNLPRVLQQVLLKIGDSQTCRQGIDAINVKMPKSKQLSYSEENNICCVSGNPDKVTDTCVGDSGGPVVREVIHTETREASWIQIGIISFGLGCGQKGFPSYYTNVARFIPWIDSKIIDNACRGPVPIVPNAISYSFSGPGIYYSNKTLPLVGYIVQYSCGENLLLVGDPPTCGSDLEWTQSTIKCVGTSLLESTCQYVCLEGIVAAKFDNFFSALVYGVCCFYIFNMQYPITATVTYEFIQRFFAKINKPGTKSAKRRKYSIHPKVAALLQRINPVSGDLQDDEE